MLRLAKSGKEHEYRSLATVLCLRLRRLMSPRAVALHVEDYAEEEPDFMIR